MKLKRNKNLLEMIGVVDSNAELELLAAGPKAGEVDVHDIVHDAENGEFLVLITCMRHEKWTGFHFRPVLLDREEWAVLPTLPPLSINSHPGAVRALEGFARKGNLTPQTVLHPDTGTLRPAKEILEKVQAAQRGNQLNWPLLDFSQSLIDPNSANASQIRAVLEGQKAAMELAG